MTSYDVITVGGGFAGTALATTLARHGLKILVLEQETAFRDRIRGEAMQPWGGAELHHLGLYDLLAQSCGHELSWFDLFMGPHQVAHRELTSTTPQGLPGFAFYHPAMQDVLAQAAEAAGAEVRRGVRVAGLEPGSPPTLHVETAGGPTEKVSARLVVGCDGRRSMVRRWAGFERRSDPAGQRIAGLLFENAQALPSDTCQLVINSQLGRITGLFPQRGGRVRAYLCWHDGDSMQFQGDKDIRRFVEESIRTGALAEYYEGAQPNGPLATFDAADTWVEHPYRNGVALIGDAAASSDPSHGCGMSLAIRDVRVLTECLLANTDWEHAGHTYAAEHDRYYGVMHRVTRWITELYLQQGPQAEARRERAFPRHAEDPMRVPDHIASGPDLPADDTVRRRFWGEC